MTNSLVFKKAKTHLVGGVNSPVRSFKYVGTAPLLIKRGKGPRVYDYDGNSYIDYVLSYGVSILGHAHPGVVRSLKNTLEHGAGFGATNSREVELAGLIKKAAPVIEKLRFVNSGTEAVLGATRLAKACTGRDKIIKFRNSYHGHADYLLEEIDKGSAEGIFKKHGSRIAGVIVEPVGGNCGVRLPDKDFLKYLRRITRKYGSLLIFDEVITGFRFKFGSVSDILGVKPDLICLGKIIGGGLPIGAYGGKARIMNKLAPLGDLYQGSTFAGNPIVMQSGIATLKVLSSSKNRYSSLEKKAKKLTDAIKKERDDLQVIHYKTIFSLRFRKKAHFQSFYKKLLKKGIYLAPSENEANFISFSHTEKDIDKTIDAVKNVLREI